MRCKSCDNVLEENEIIWYPDKQCHEELCRCCRKIIFDLENNYSEIEGLVSPTEEIEDGAIPF